MRFFAASISIFCFYAIHAADARADAFSSDGNTNHCEASPLYSADVAACIRAGNVEHADYGIHLAFSPVAALSGEVPFFHALLVRRPQRADFRKPSARARVFRSGLSPPALG